MIDRIVRLFGFGGLLDKINGAKAYVGGTVEILTGIAGICVSAANLIQSAATCDGIGCLVGWARALSHDPNAAALAVSFAAIGHGLAAIGNRHATAKLEAKIVGPSPI